MLPKNSLFSLFKYKLGGNFFAFLIFSLLAVLPLMDAAGQIPNPLNIKKIVADPTRSRAYAVHQASGGAAGAMIVINPITEQVIDSVTVGVEPTDLAITNEGSEILVINPTSKSIHRINLETLAVVATYNLSAFNDRNDDFGGHVADGPGDIIYYVDEQWGPRLRVFDSGSGSVLQTFGATTTGTGNDYGFGNIVVNDSQTKLYAWVQYGGWVGSFVVEYNISPTGSLTYVGSSSQNIPTPFSRNPLDTPALLSSDGQKLFVKQHQVNLANLSQNLWSTPTEIYAISPNGEIAVTDSEIYKQGNSTSLHSLSTTTNIKAITYDYSKLIQYNTSTNLFEYTDLVAAVGAEDLGLEVYPGDSSVISTPSELRWYPTSGASSYQIYLGTNQSAVNGASTSDPEYLGSSNSPEFDVSSFSFSPGQTYYWRIVPIMDGSPVPGTTRSFLVADISFSRSSVSSELIVGVRNHREQVGISADSPTAWTASTTTPWISINTVSGTTPGSLDFTIDSNGLAAGDHSGSVTFIVGGVQMNIPVSLRLIEANYTLAKADSAAPYIYAISQTSESSADPAHLVLINTETETIERSVLVGNSVTDLAIHYPENRIYVTNWKTGRLLALDRNTLEEVQFYSFTPAGAWDDVYRIAPGPAGRLIVEEEDQRVDVRIMNTGDGTFLGTTSESEGGGLTSPLGGFYFHGDSNSSGAELHRFDLAGDAFNETHAVRVTGVSYYGSRTVTSSADGTRVYWNGGVFDGSDLSLYHLFSTEVLSATRGGEAIFTGTEFYSGTNYAKLADIPNASTVQAIEKDQGKLYTFNGNTFSIYDFSTIIPVSSAMTPSISDGSTTIPNGLQLSWSLEPIALSYDVYFGASQAAVDAATTASGEFLGNQTGNLYPGALPALTPGDQYFWRVDVNTLNGVITGSTWAFHVAPFDLDLRSLSLSTPVNIDPLQQSVQISAGSALSWTASTEANWIDLSNVSGTTDSNLNFDIDVTSLAEGNHSASITISAGGLSYELPVSLDVFAINYTLAKSDLLSPYIYAISQTSESSTDPAYLILINTETETIERAVPVGNSVTDLAIHYPENRIYVTNWKTGRLLALDRNTLEEVQFYSFTPAGSGDDVYRIAPGPAGRLIVEEEDQRVYVRIMNTGDGTFLGTTSEREGGGGTSPLGDFYFHGDDNSTGAELHRFDLAGDAFNETHAVRVTGVSYYGSRTVASSADGTRVYWNGGVFDGSDLSLFHLFNTEVLSATRGGEAIFTGSEFYSGTNYAKLADIPNASTVQAIEKDQGKLYTFSGNTFSIYDFSSIIPVSSELTPSITDGNTAISNGLELSWSLEPFALSYDVYFGASQAAVDSATTASAEFLGNQTGNAYTGALPALTPGGQHFWRIDTRTYNGTIVGSIWSFHVAPFDLDLRSLSLSTPFSIDPLQQSVQISAGSAISWTASTEVDWINLSNVSGTTDSSLNFNIDVTNLAVGNHSASITISAGGLSYELPVSLNVLTLNYTLAKSDLLSAYIYAISQTSESSTDPAYLILINTETETIERAVPVGNSVTDLAIHYPENRIYVTNWKTGRLLALDRNSLDEVQFYSFTPAGSGDDVYRIAPGPAGRLIVEEEDQWIDVRIMNTGDGTFLGTTYEREGGGVTSPLGDFYFHGDNNSSGAELHRFDLAGDAFNETHAVKVTGVSSYGSRTVASSADGTRVYWNGGVFDGSDLSLSHLFNTEVLSATRRGEAIFTGSEFYSGTNYAKLEDIPNASTVQAIEKDQQKLYTFNGNTFSIYDFSSIIPVSSEMTPSISDGGTVIPNGLELSWSLEPFAVSYDVYFGASQAAVDTATTASAEFLGNQTGNLYTGALPVLTPGGQYFWRIDIRTFNGTIVGSIWSFHVAPFDLDLRSLSLSTPVSIDPPQQSVQISAGSAVSWTASTEADWINLSNVSGTTDSSLNFDIDVTSLAVGNHSASITISAGGLSYELPVSLDVLTLNYTLAKSDLRSPYIYAISQTSESSTDPAYLILINTETETIERAVPVGNSVTDLTIHYPENRIYVTNWKTGRLLALDRDTLAEVQTYPFTPAGSGDDVYRIAPGPAGRLIVEEEDQWIDVRIMNTGDGTFLGTTFEREGGGVTSPLGDFYFHGENNISNAALHRLSLAGDSFSETHFVRVTGYSYYGSRRVVRSAEGDIVCWNGGVFDTTDLGALVVLNSEVISIVEQWNRRLYTTASGTYNEAGNILDSLPQTATVQAVSKDQQKVYLFNGNAFSVYNPPALINASDFSTVDSDGDGYSDMEEAAFGSNRLDLNSRPKFTLTRNGDTSVSVGFNRHSANAPFQYSIEVSEDLETWMGVSEASGFDTNILTGLQNIEVDLDMQSNSRGFLRVRVTAE